MKEENIVISFEGNKREILQETFFSDLAHEYRQQYKDDIVLASLNNRLYELNHEICKSGELTFITTADEAGKKAYRRSMTLMMQKALYNLLGKEKSKVRILYSVSQAYYCELPDYGKPDDTLMEELTKEMLTLCDRDIPIVKDTINTEDAIELFHQLGMKDKEKLFSYRRSSKVNIYDLDGYLDYFFGYMVLSTSFLRYFCVECFKEGFVLRFPNKETKQVALFTPSYKHFDARVKSSEWGNSMGIDTIGALNDTIAKGKTKDLILVQEALMERRIGQLAETIVDQKEKKIILIAGPSSSGKTTFAQRLSIQLSALGLIPSSVSLDNYYLDRDQTPIDEQGKPDFECIEALDVKQFHEDMEKLLNKEEVSLPYFNFKTGKREYKGKRSYLGDNDILLIEGIHGLNDLLSANLPKKNRYKIYISPLTHMNIDEHNYLPTTDTRLLRRIVRDARTRNTTAAETLAMWDSVKRGEEKYIFPFQDSADILFNSALIYELAVLKLYAEPLLFQIQKNDPEHIEAKRLLKFLDYFLPITGEEISSTSILREFIGGGCFNL